jgi:hypothetical protein
MALFVPSQKAFDDNSDFIVQSWCSSVPSFRIAIQMGELKNPMKEIIQQSFG